MVDISFEYILKQRIALKACNDWLFKQQISFTVHLRAIHVGLCLKYCNRLHHLFMLYHLAVLNYTKTTTGSHLSVGGKQWTFALLL